MTFALSPAASWCVVTAAAGCVAVLVAAWRAVVVWRAQRRYDREFASIIHHDRKLAALAGDGR